jgi:hypothetical protein
MEGDRKLGVTALEKENQIIGFTYESTPHQWKTD